MFKSLFHYPRVFSRHANGPLAEERNTFLKHLASRGTPRSTLLRYARQLRVIAVLLDRYLPGPISREQIARHAQQWAQGQQRRGQRLHVWTVDAPADMDRMIYLGVDDLITNEPAEALVRVHEYERLNRSERTLRRVRAWLAQ